MNNNVYVLEWYGPFSSPSDVKEWENEEKGNAETRIYLFKGKKKNAKTHEGIYCGQAWNQTAGERLSNKTHHINDYIKNKEALTIYVAKFSNKKPKKEDVNKVEKLLTAVIDQTVCHNKLEIVNLTNKHRPKDKIYLINEWYKVDGTPRTNYMRDSICSHINDLIVSYPDDDEKVSYVWGSKRISFINTIK